jgi:hypothetical protein
MDRSAEIMASNAKSPDRLAMKASDVRFFWPEGGTRTREDLYHWCVDCAWVLVAAWHGARVVSSEAPPPDAGDAGDVREFLEEHLSGPAWSTSIVQSRPGEAPQAKRSLCEVCCRYVPRPVAVVLPVEEERCVKCGCSRDIHLSYYRGFFDTGCGMAWLEWDFGYGPDPDCTGLVHCPCDGYEPPAGGGP